MSIVNRWASIDSTIALDERSAPVIHGDMHVADTGAEQPLQLLVLERRDDARNMARWYVLSIEPTLFGDQALIREWGRTGSAGRRLGNPYSSKAAAAEALEAWLARKLTRG